MVSINRERIRILGKVLFILYIGFIIYFLLFSDWYGRTGGMEEYHYNLMLFREIRRFWEYRSQVGWFVMFTNLFGNVLIFVPFGFFMPMASRYRSFSYTVFWSFILSLCVEMFQLFARIGSFDVDDLLLNTAGGLVGYCIFMICVRIRRRYDHKKEREEQCAGQTQRIGKAA